MRIQRARQCTGENVVEHVRDFSPSTLPSMVFSTSPNNAPTVELKTQAQVDYSDALTSKILKQFQAGQNSKYIIKEDHDEWKAKDCRGRIDYGFN